MLNWLARYAFVIERRLRRRRRPPVLDVGSGPYGIGFWTGEAFVGVDLSFPAAPCPANFALKADGAALPFADAAFEEVVLADLLEHVPPGQRPAVLKEALRVAARRVYITFPTGEAARRADRAFAEYHRRVFGSVPGWVEEHEACPLPDPAALAGLLEPMARERKLRFKSVPGEDARFHLLLTLVDHLPGGFSAALSEAARAELSGWLQLLRRASVPGSAGAPYRVNWVIELAGRPRPLLSRLEAEPDLFQILVCPACRRGLLPEPDALICPWCGTAYGRDRGRWDLTPRPAGRPADPIAELREYLGPEFDPAVFAGVPEQVEAEFAASAGPADFYKNSRMDLYDLTLWDLSGAKAPALRLIRALSFPDDPVLDYGCGIGADGLRLVDLGFSRVAFADFENPSTRYLKWRLDRRGGGVACAPVYDIERDAIRRHYLVYALDRVEYVPDARAFLKTLERLGDVVVANFLLEPPPKATDTAYPEYYRQVRRLTGRIRRGRCVLFDDTYRFEVKPGMFLNYRLLGWYSRPRPFLSVIIATYNRPGDLARCLESLAAQSLRRREFEVVVVDDGSGPEQAAELQRISDEFRQKLKLKFIRQAHRGPAAARNRGIRAARGHVLLFLNDDVTLPPDGLERWVRFHRNHPEPWVGMLGRVEWAPELPLTPLMEYVTGAGGQQFDFRGLVPGKEVDFWRFYGTALSVQRRFVLESGELFDPDFPALWDDIEWGYRLAAKGLKVYFQPEAVVYHHHRVDADYYVRRQRLAGRMAVAFARKHPELAPRLLPGGPDRPAVPPAEIEALKAQVDLLEKVVPENPELRPALDDAYGHLFWAAYRLGIAEGLDTFGAPPSAPELIRRAEAELKAGRPLKALSALRPLRWGPAEVRVLYRLAAALAGRVRELETALSPQAGRARALWRALAAALGPPAAPGEGAPAGVLLEPEAEEYAVVLHWLLKLGLDEQFDRVFFLAGAIWPDDRERATKLARIAARAGRWLAAAALLEPPAQALVEAYAEARRLEQMGAASMTPASSGTEGSAGT